MIEPIGGFKGAVHPPPKCDLSSLVLADYSGILEISNEVLDYNSSKTFKGHLQWENHP